VVTLDTAKTDRNAIIAHMVGREMDNLFPRRPTTPGETLLSVKGLSVAERAGEKARLSGISFDLRQGEVLGIGGLMGAGRSELLMHLFGIWGKRTAGSATLEKAPLGGSPGACIKQGLVLVTEDRKRYGLVLDQTVGFNLSLSAIAEFSQNQFVDRDQEMKKNAEYVSSLRIKASSQETITRTLSGGNQQKIVLGKALMTKPKVVLLDEPTRGIDVGAKFEIYELINDLKAQGVAVLLVSSELPELIGMSDRILMLAEGRIGGSFEGSAITQEALLAAAMRPTEPATPASAQEVA
jgi:D-xylose transport system ATP-binding protein